MIYLAQASFLNSLEMGVELLMLILILPFLTRILPSFQRLSPSIKDKYIAEWSLVALAVGQLCLGFAPVVAVAILGMYMKHPNLSCMVKKIDMLIRYRRRCSCAGSWARFFAALVGD